MAAEYTYCVQFDIAVRKTAEDLKTVVGERKSMWCLLSSDK